MADTAIAQVAEEIGERPGMRQMGQVMKAATAIAAGKADGARLSAAVKDRCSPLRRSFPGVGARVFPVS